MEKVNKFIDKFGSGILEKYEYLVGKEVRAYEILEKEDRKHKVLVYTGEDVFLSIYYTSLPIETLKEIFEQRIGEITDQMYFQFDKKELFLTLGNRKKKDIMRLPLGILISDIDEEGEYDGKRRKETL